MYGPFRTAQEKFSCESPGSIKVLEVRGSILLLFSVFDTAWLVVVMGGGGGVDGRGWRRGGRFGRVVGGGVKGKKKAGGRRGRRHCVDDKGQGVRVAAAVRKTFLFLFLFFSPRNISLFWNARYHARFIPGPC